VQNSCDEGTDGYGVIQLTTAKNRPHRGWSGLSALLPLVQGVMGMCEAEPKRRAEHERTRGQAAEYGHAQDRRAEDELFREGSLGSALDTHGCAGPL